MNENDFSNLGRKIQETVQDAVESMNYDRLNQTINQTVSQALDEAKIYKEKLRWQYEETQRKQAENRREQYEKAQRQQEENVRRQQTQNRTNMQGQRTSFQQAGYTKPVSRKQQIQMVLAPKVKKGTVRIVLGSLLSAVSVVGILGIVLTKSFLEMIGTAGLAEMLLGPGALGIPFAAGIGILLSGRYHRKWYKRAKEYAEVLNGRGFCEVTELAQRTNRTEAEVRRDLRKLIQKRVFREAYLDKKETCLMINQIAYNYYLQAEESLRQRELEEAKRKEQEAKMTPEILEMIRIGDEYIRTIREANDDIPGEVISAKLDRLEQVVRRIFESVKKHPEQKKEMDKFMDYYMPTTLKLVNAYREFDDLEVKGENVTTAMQEIEDTLDTINMAFEKLLDDLFQDTAFDVATDISVLEMMLAREGYKEKDFK